MIDFPVFLSILIGICILRAVVASRAGSKGRADRGVRLVRPTYQLCWEV